MATLTLVIVAADGTKKSKPVIVPDKKPRIRIAGIAAASIEKTLTWDGTKWI